MEQFEVGKIYKSYRENEYIKVTKRTDVRIYYVFLNPRNGREYNLGSKQAWKKPETWEGFESIYVRYIAAFSAKNVISQKDFDELVANHIAEEKRIKEERDARVEKDTSEGAQKIREFCAARRISFDFLMECHDLVESVSTNALKRVALEVNSDYFTREE